MRVVASSSSGAERGKNAFHRDLGYLFKNRLSLQIECPARSAAHLDDSNAVDLNVGFLEELLQLTIGIPRRVVLPVQISSSALLV